MAMNYASKWNDGLLAILNQNCLTSPFITSNVKWLDARTFHFTQMSVSGYKNHSRNGGYNSGAINQADKAFTVAFDRDVEFFVDKADVDETNASASAENISAVFQQTQAVPEVDAYFFSKVYDAASKANLVSTTAANTYTVANVFTKLKELLKKGKIRLYKARGTAIMYVNSDIMDLLERSTELSKKIELTTVADGGVGIETRVTTIDNVPVIEVIDDDRFYDVFNFNGSNGGYEKIAGKYEEVTLTAGDSLKGLYAESSGTYTKQTSGTYSTGTYYKKIDGSRKINALVACTDTCFTVPKMESIYFFAPGEHTKGDGYLYQNRSLKDTFVFPNGTTGQIDSCAVDVDTTEYTAA